MTTFDLSASTTRVHRDVKSSRFRTALGRRVSGMYQNLVDRLRQPRVRYFKRLVQYTLRERALLALTAVIGILGFSLAFVIPYLVGAAIDTVIAPHAVNGVVPDAAVRTHRLMVLIGIGIATSVGHALVAYGRGQCCVELGHRIITRLRCDLFEHFQRLSLHFYAKERTGSIASRLLHDVHAATSIIYGGMIVVVLDAIQLLVAIVLLTRISAKLTLACLIVLPLYAVTFKVFNPWVRRASERLHQHYCKISGNVQEQLAGIALTKTFAAEDREQKRFREDVQEHHEKVTHQSHIGHLVNACSEVLVHLGTVLVIGYGSWLALQGELTAGDVTRFLGYVGIMYGPVRRFAELNVLYQNSLSAIVRVFRVFDIKPKIVDAPHAVTVPPHHGRVEFEGVRFRYADDSDESRISLEDETVEQAENGEDSRDREKPLGRWILNGLDVEVDPGERIALVGPSGAGKTTLVSLLPRLYDVGEGAIRIDGVDLRDYSLKALRQSMAVVQQDSFVFSGTIRENLAYGKPQATDAEIISAAKAANAHGFITDLPEGYETRLGERGVNLSGGQRQRLSIARALLKDPRILILDEATSALDTESEALVQAALDRLMRGRTCFIIAHRLSTVRNADRILVLKEGRVAESGRHEDLLEQRGLYARLCKQQFSFASTQVDELQAV